ncbi:hypothetical protein F4861DRAFT_358135 [Xylaria intraflava]|nr:hypothetical protein F4861DRAFT_358135 [Xylaria intraflava]
MPPTLAGLAASRWAYKSATASKFTPSLTAAGAGAHDAGPDAASLQHAPSSSSADVFSRFSRNDQPSSPQQQLARFSKIAARLKWKIPFLETGYMIAVDRVGKPQQESDANEIHFKLDFHEFYMLIERALVHLMGVYGIVVYSQADMNGNGHGVGDVEQNNHPANFRDRSQPHRYHENVLLALDDPQNPLHETLGQPVVRKQLWRAKELRNRWKDADNDDHGRFMPAPLEAYNLKEILQTILLALEWAFDAADKFVRQHSPDPQQNRPTNFTANSEDWEFMVDAMDWEVV